MPRHSDPRGFSEEVKRIVLRRGSGSCDRCGTRPAAEFHHRQPRGMGGARGARAVMVNGAANCVALCCSCHSWVEGNRREAAAAGWIVSRYREPADVPVVWRFGWGRGWALLDNDGNVTKVTPL